MRVRRHAAAGSAAPEAARDFGIARVASTGRELVPREAMGWFALVAAFFGGGYYALAALTTGAPARDLTTPLDGSVPFSAGWVLIYAAVYPMATLPLFVVRDADLLRRVARAYLVVIAVSFVCFAAFPISAVPLRTGVPPLDPERFLEWGTRLLYRLDPPRNLMPSLHVALATLAVVGSARANPRFAWGGAVVLTVIGIAVVGLRQHYAVDVLAGFGLALGVAFVSLRSWRPDPAFAPMRSMHAALGCVAIYVGGVVAFAVAFGAGL